MPRNNSTQRTHSNRSGNLKKRLMEKKAIRDKAQRDFEMCEKSWKAKSQVLKSITKKMKEHYTTMQQARTLLLLRAKLESSPLWKDANKEFVQGELNLESVEDVEAMGQRECLKVLCVLKSMKYEETEFFQGLWGGLAPEGYDSHAWRQTYGYEPNVLVGCATRKELHKRVCDYLGLGKNGGQEDENLMIPADA